MAVTREACAQAPASKWPQCYFCGMSTTALMGAANAMPEFLVLERKKDWRRWKMPLGAVSENPHLSDNTSPRDSPWCLCSCTRQDSRGHPAPPPACLPGTQQGLCAQAPGGPSPHTGLYQAHVETVLGGNSLLKPACCYLFF